MPKRDKYDKAIKYLTEHPDEIYNAWLDTVGATEHVAHCLFTRTTPTGRRDHSGCGCLTQIRGGHYRAPSQDLTERIQADERIPKSPLDVTAANLPIFAEWQRRIDKELGRP